ncbi:MAG: NADH-quinone oxidoreductase subunit NuoH [Thermaerobacter sp.]|nr:NADH-quinone oxidoreductase subunit NuoH [Thermaerobacter sp.]
MSLLLGVIIKSLILIVLLMSGFAGVMLFERKLLGWFHLRLGPNRVGPWGLLQPLADGLKLALKEDVLPDRVDSLVYHLAPVISLFTALAAFAVIPVGPSFTAFGARVTLSIASPSAGIVYLLAIFSLAVYGITLAGWSSQSKYALLGGVRSTAQLISYELAMGVAIVGSLILAGSGNLAHIVDAQRSMWYVVFEPLGFLIYFICAVADTNRPPFDLPEADAELVAGYHTEYSGMRFAMFFMAEYINIITVSAVATLLFLGGWQGPVAPSVVWFLLKVAALVFVFVWLRATLPRLRYDRLMAFGWKVLLPVALVQLVAVAAFVAWGVVPA